MNKRVVCLNGVKITRSHIVATAARVYGLNKTACAQAKLRVRQVEFSATPDGIVVSSPVWHSVVVHHEHLLGGGPA